jgi:hypothetical protein
MRGNKSAEMFLEINDKNNPGDGKEWMAEATFVLD